MTATDPSGAPTTQTVSITITNANEAPTFSDGTPAGSNAAKELWLRERDSESGTLYTAYTSAISFTEISDTATR